MSIDNISIFKFITVILIVISIYFLFCCSFSFSKNKVHSIISNTQGTPVIIKWKKPYYLERDYYLFYNPKKEDKFTLSSGNKSFIVIDPIKKNKIEMKVGKENEKKLCIEYGEFYSEKYKVSTSNKKKSNSCILRIFKTSKGYCIKFFNDYYLCFDKNELEENDDNFKVIATKDHDSIIYFDIIKL